MKSEYDRIRFYGNTDLSIGIGYEKAKKILDEFDVGETYNDINDVIELYNIYQIFTSGAVKEEYIRPYAAKVKDLMHIISRFFQKIDDDSLRAQYSSVCKAYCSSFWELFVKFKLYDKISSSALRQLLEEDQMSLYNILRRKKLVLQYDLMLAQNMREFGKTAEILIKKYLEKRDDSSKGNVYIPPSLRPAEFETILNDYMESDNPNIGFLQLLAKSQSGNEFPISDELRLKAKKKATEFWRLRMDAGNNVKFRIIVRFEDIKEPVILERPSEIDYKFTYDAKWIRENLDYPTILNNFVYLFNYTDSHFLCSFPSIRSDIGTIESLVGTKGIKEYEIGTIFHFKEVKSSLVMRGYMYFLSQHSVHIEDVYKWFFEEYLRDEFNIEGFIFNGPKHSQSFLEKCRTLPSEMDGVFKQYSLYVRNHTIDRELLEMSSNPINFALVPSLINNKYVYSNSEAIEKEQRLMFSDQTMLGYFPNQGEEYESFFDALSAQDVNISDYPEWELGGIQWLNERNVIKIDSSGKIHMNKLRVRLLRDLYKQEVICASYYHDKTEIEKLIDSEDLRYGSTLFSIPEQHYLNYILNKSEHSNGLDLRNKYIHSTYPLGEKQQEEDYVTLLKIMAVVILKINEEFCLINSMGNG